MDDLTDREKLIASVAPLKAVLDSKAAKDNETLRRAVKAAAVHTSREIQRDG